MLDYLFSGELVTISQIAMTIFIAVVVYRGYKRNTFPATLAMAAIIFEIVLVSVFLYHQHATGHISEEVAEEAHYMVLAMIHGILSLYAIGHALQATLAAKKAYATGVNYFYEHKTAGIVLVVAWALSLVTGVFL